MRDIVAAARALATVAHMNVTDKIGAPYIEHPKAVASAVRLEGYDETHQAVAWLHDVVEDTDWTVYEIGILFGDEIANAVRAITKRPSETLDDYYTKVLGNPIARVVKWYDVEHNSSPYRLAALDEATRERLTAKYEHAKAVLGGAE